MWQKRWQEPHVRYPLTFAPEPCPMSFIRNENTHTGVYRQADLLKDYVNVCHSLQKWFCHDLLLSLWVRTRCQNLLSAQPTHLLSAVILSSLHPYSSIPATLHLDLERACSFVSELQHCSSLSLQMYPPVLQPWDLSPHTTLHFSSFWMPAPQWVCADHCDPNCISLPALPAPLTAIVSLTLPTT